MLNRSLDICGALNQSGTRCRSVPSNEPGCDGWRCLKHRDWYTTATKEEREALALIEIAESIAALGETYGEDLETRRSGRKEPF